MLNDRNDKREKEIKNFFLNIQTGIVTDAMVMLGLEGWMNEIFPMNPDHRIFGRAFTINLAPVRNSDEPNYSFYDLAGKWNDGDIIVVGGEDRKSVV